MVGRGILVWDWDCSALKESDDIHCTVYMDSASSGLVQLCRDEKVFGIIIVIRNVDIMGLVKKTLLEFWFSPSEKDEKFVWHIWLRNIY